MLSRLEGGGGKLDTYLLIHEGTMCLLRKTSLVVFRKGETQIQIHK